MRTQTLHHADIIPSGAAARLTRATLTPARPDPLHDHDFYELFWVQNGTVRHHLPDKKETLREGDIVFVSPEHAHGLQGKGEAAMVVSISLHPALITELAQQHPQLQGRFFWQDSATPVQSRRDIRQMAQLNQAALQLERSAGDRLAALAFLMPLLSDLLPAQDFPGAPAWLTRACIAAQDPAVFSGGAAALVAMTGHTHPHVSRAMRRYLDLTPSDYINNQRMRHAARLLTTDSEPLADIATACGIPNLSHFHKLFRATHGMTPRAYRQKYQRHVVQPKP